MARLPVRFVGLTNAGKSSLINALVGETACLVSEQPTTTRDRRRVDLTVGSWHFALEDGPGLDEGDSPFARATERSRELAQ